MPPEAAVVSAKRGFGLRLEARTETPRWLVYTTPLLALALTVLSGAGLFALLGVDPLTALYGFFIEPISDLYGWTELGVKAIPLALIALGLSLGFRANVWNIGAEGQLTVGAICAGGVALAFWSSGGWWTLPIMALAGLGGGIAYAAIPALLRTRFNANEILTSLMLTYVAQLFLGYLVTGPWRDPDGFNFPQSRPFDADALMPPILEGFRLHWGLLVVILAAVAAQAVLTRSLLGYKLMASGLAPAAARFAGFSAPGVVWTCLLIGGGCAGLAGMLEVAGPIGQLMPTVSPGYGFTAIIVAFLGRLNPFGICAAALLLALSYIGSEAAQVTLKLSASVGTVFQGLLLFFVLACDVLLAYRIRRL
jgi:simple sugar transport system permease protein